MKAEDLTLTIVFPKSQMFGNIYIFDKEICLGVEK